MVRRNLFNRIAVKSRKGFRRFEKSKDPQVRELALFGRAFLNTPGSFGRFSTTEFKKPLIENPNQLKKKRFRPFLLIVGPPILIRQRRLK
jgi:hypothetical protein